MPAHNITHCMCAQNAYSCSCMTVYRCTGGTGVSFMLRMHSSSRVFIVLCTHIDQTRVVSLSQVVQHRGFVEAGEIGHVLHFTEARRVHPLHLLPGQSQLPLAVCKLDLYLIAPLLPNTGRLGVREKSVTRCFKLT